MNDLGERDYRILDALPDQGGLMTRRVALRAWTSADRRGSAMCRQALLRLQRMGFVGPLDMHKPIVWCRTAAGTAELSRAYEKLGFALRRQGSGA